MSRIAIPKELVDLMEDSDLFASLRSLADRVREVLEDNKLPFFPDYTDHGLRHVEAVLKTMVDLVPDLVWKQSEKNSNPRLLCDADAVLIIGGALVHDIAMHLRPEGFLELVSEGSRFRPLPWFNQNHEGHRADTPWQELWENYVREARRFSERQLTDIVGEKTAQIWKFEGLPENSGQWDRNHCLIIGEFIRRHHARLAHEIAIYGFPGLQPGLGKGQFPAMGSPNGHPLSDYADLIGLTARSHGMSLRVCKEYLKASPVFGGTPKPMGTAVLYPMALLRVADYLQIDGQRAPAVLLQLRNPQSPISVQEWQKHLAVLNIGPSDDPRGRMVTVSRNLSLPTYLQLKDLLADLQKEMDHSTAVLDETYGNLTELGLQQLSLGVRRVYSNLDSPSFRDSLPYVPERTGFSSDPELLALLVAPLYGNHPGVGVRELIQNATDAVRELDAWCTNHKIDKDSLVLPEQDCDVLVDFIEKDDDAWILRVTDRGIGMTSETIQNYFLRAGASFRKSAEWAKEFQDENGKLQVLRSGRFGIGAFAVFLLGDSFTLRTRHAGAAEPMGFEIEASAASKLIEIRRIEGLPVGTRIEVKLSIEAKEAFQLGFEQAKSAFARKNLYAPERPSLARITDWYCLDYPVVQRRVIAKDTQEFLPASCSLSLTRDCIPPEWRIIRPKGYDAVYWTYGCFVPLSCNGMEIRSPWPSSWRYRSDYLGHFIMPCIAINDSSANLPLTVQRYDLSTEELPFEGELLRDVSFDAIAYALVCGPSSLESVLNNTQEYPLLLKGCYPTEGDVSVGSMMSPLTWCGTISNFTMADTWLFRTLGKHSCAVVCVHWPDGFIIDENAIGYRDLGATMSDSAFLPIINVTEGNIDQEDQFQRISERHECLGSTLTNGKQTSVGFIVRSCCQIVNFHRLFPHSVDLRWHPDGLPEVKPLADPEVLAALSIQLSQSDCSQDVREYLADWVHRWMRSVRSLDGGTVPGEEVPVAIVAVKAWVEPEEAPTSLLAQLWHESLGETAIPFDPHERELLIQRGRKHPELKRHIDAWTEMKKAGSKWVQKG